MFSGVVIYVAVVQKLAINDKTTQVEINQPLSIESLSTMTRDSNVKDT